MEIAANVESEAISTTQPSANPDTLEAAWADLGGPEPFASMALLTMASQPEKSVALLARELPPLQLTAEQFEPLMVALASDDEKVWRPASEQLKYFDPRLAVGLEELMERFQEAPARNRLVGVLSVYPYEGLKDKVIDLRGNASTDEDGGFNFVIYDSEQDFLKKRGGGSIWAEHLVKRIGVFGDGGKAKWTRAIRGIVLLEHIGTPAARAVVDKLATGHPDAQPTSIAKDAIAKRKP